MNATLTMDPGGMEHAGRITQHADMNAGLTMDPGGAESMEHAERIIAHAEMLMANAEQNDASTAELGGEAIATEIMEHTQKILQHAMQHAEMVMAYAEMRKRLKETGCM